MKPYRSITGIGLALLFALAAAPLFSQDYSLFGEIDMEGCYARTPGGEAPNSLDYTLGIEANHRLEYDTLTFIARHRAELDRRETIEHELYEAYIDYHLNDRLDLAAGKQRIPWGRGIAFFPTDTLHPSHTREDVEGFTGLSLILVPNLNTQLTGVVDFTAPLSASNGTTDNETNEDFYNDLKYALYASILAGKADMALSMVYLRDRTFRPGFGISYDIAGYIITSECALEFSHAVEYPDESINGFETDSESGPHVLASAGLSRTFFPEAHPDLRLMFAEEYLYAGTGYSKDERTDYFSLIGSYTGEEPSVDYLGRHYLFSLASFEYYQHVRLELSTYISLADRSAYWSAKGTLLAVANMNLNLQGEMLTGSSRTEFGSQKASEGDWRLTLESVIHF
jgi:hypothetical protein